MKSSLEKPPEISSGFYFLWFTRKFLQNNGLFAK